MIGVVNLLMAALSPEIRVSNSHHCFCNGQQPRNPFHTEIKTLKQKVLMVFRCKGYNTKNRLTSDTNISSSLSEKLNQKKKVLSH